jgi:hypothetical protein
MGFLDRGLIDAAVGLQELTSEMVLTPLRDSHRFHQRVFLTPPWPEIYRTDPERRHDLDSASPSIRDFSKSTRRWAMRSFFFQSCGVGARQLRPEGLRKIRRACTSSRNQDTTASGEQIKIPARTRLRFTPAKALKDVGIGRSLNSWPGPSP